MPKRVVQLLASAYEERFTGSLILEDHARKLSAVRFVDGLVVQVAGAWQSEAVERGALALFLPPPAIALATQHGRTYGIDLFSAVDQLALLPTESLRAAVEALVTRGIEKLSAQEPFAQTRQRPGTGRLKNSPTLEPGLPPWNLIVSGVLASADSPAVPVVNNLRGQVLGLSRASLDELRASMIGPARAVVENLLRQPRRVEELEALNLVASERLMAVLYALWLTGQLGPESTPRRTGAPPASESPPSFEEQQLEGKVMEAWMRAEADESRVDKASALASRAVTVFPANPQLRFFSACLHQRAQRLDQARSEFSKALELDPYYSDARRELARLESRENEKRSRNIFGKR